MTAPATSLIKALDLISYLVTRPEGERVQAIVSSLGLPRPTVIRFLQTLQGYGLVEKRKSLYRLTDRFYEWASRNRHDPLRRRYRPLLESIARKTGELVLLGLQEGNAIVHIDYIESDEAVRVAPAPTTRHDLRTSALGKLALSRTPHLRKRVTDPELLAELKAIDDGAPAWNRQESNQGVIAMAEWGLCQASSEPMIAVAWPSFRFTESKAEEARLAIWQACRTKGQK